MTSVQYICLPLFSLKFILVVKSFFILLYCCLCWWITIIEYIMHFRFVDDVMFATTRRYARAVFAVIACLSVCYKPVLYLNC